MEEKIFDCIILGGGPAGMSAAMYAKRANLDVAIVDVSSLGGKPMEYLEIENYLGFEKIQGFELAQKFELHIDKFDIPKFMYEEIKKVDLTEDIKTVETKKGVYKAKSIIIATGANPCKLAVKGENEFVGRGVSYCAVCDGAFYKNKDVLVIGGGNAAVEEGMYLTRFAKTVYIMHRRNKLRADKIIQDRAFKNEKIKFIFDAVVEEIIGDGNMDNERVSFVKYKNLKTGESLNLSVSGVFPYIGFCPNTEFFNGQIVQDEKGFIMVNENMQTSEIGVFAVGDVRKTPLRQVITAVSDGAVAGTMAAKFVEDIKYIQKEGAISIQ